MEVDQFSKLLSKVDDVLKDEPGKDDLKAAIVSHIIQSGKAGLVNKLLGSGLISGDSLLTKNWRPLLVGIFTFILVNNYIIYPYLHLFVDGAPYFQLEENAINGIMAYLVAYAGGRTVEKTFQIKSANNKPAPVEDEG